MKNFLYLIAMISSVSYGFECPELENSITIENAWAHRSEVYIATVESGRRLYDDNHDFEYTLKVKHSLKGRKLEFRNVKGDWSLRLSIGDQYIFFVKNDDIDFCDLYFIFSYQWLERKDIPRKRARVEKVVELSGYKP